MTVLAKSIIEGLTDYFLQCPLLEDGVFRVDALGSAPVEYALEPAITSPVLKKYIDVAPRENFANILDAIDRFVFFENRRKSGDEDEEE